MTRLLPAIAAFLSGAPRATRYADLTLHAIHTRHTIGQTPGSRAALANLRAASHR